MQKSVISDQTYPENASYQYSPRLYLWRVIVQGIICIALAGYGIYEVAFNQSYLFAICTVVGAYGAIKTFVSHMYPKSISFEDGVISFINCFGSRQSYTISQLKNVRLRENPSTRRLFVRMDNDNFFTGRYWIDTRFYSKPEELFWRICDVEVMSNPDSLRARARLSNAKSAKNTKKKPRSARGCARNEGRS